MRPAWTVVAEYVMHFGHRICEDLGIDPDLDLDTHRLVAVSMPVGCDACNKFGTPGRWPDGDACAYCGDPGVPVFVSPEVARLIEAVGADILPALLRVAYDAPIACWRAHGLVPSDGHLNPWPVADALGEALGGGE